MNEKGLKLLARETAAQIKKKAARKVTDRLYVHVKGVPRKQELEDLQHSKRYRAALKEHLAGDALYQDCVTLNMQPGSLLVQKYLEDEEAYDAVADSCEKRITAAARKYTAKKERRFLSSYDPDGLIAEVRASVAAEFAGSMKRHLLNDSLRVPAPAPESRGDRRRRSGSAFSSVAPDNYELFEESLASMSERDYLYLAGYPGTSFDRLLADAIMDRHGELAELRAVDFHDVWENELRAGGMDLLLEMKRYFSGRRLFDLVSRNRHLKKAFESMRLLREELIDRVPERMPDLFPAARRMERRFILHIGPTNSGKTYSAVERLKEAERGIYLGPLRLLAYEQYQKLNEQGYPCSLLTGEERQLVPGAALQASTVEMADVYADYDIAVIDEAQMVADRDRGWAWTTALLGLKADEIHVCIAPYAEKIITSLIADCGDTCEIVHHERQTPLICDRSKFRLSKEFVRRHDALIVFSRRNVHAVAGELRTMGISCSVIYGNLPYDVRQEEARRFRDGETDVVVATDAIGMGMNLPIERLVFLEISKFDGTDTRLLKPAEIQQIAGRAGRRGIYDRGLWNALEGRDLLESAIDLEIPQIETVYAGFPESLIGVDGKLSTILNEWRNIEAPAGYVLTGLEHEYELCRWLEEKTDDKRLIYRLITIPFDEDDQELRQLWESYSAHVLYDGTISLTRMRIAPPAAGMTLNEAEALYKEYDLAYAFLVKFGTEEEAEIILEYKKDLSGVIAELLKKSRLPFKACKYCGHRLRWNYPFGICERCYSEMHGRRRHRWKEYY